MEEWSLELTRLYACGSFPQFNLLTDRMMLDKMNNCGAGVTNITLAPNGKFYICPAFYYSDEDREIFNVGNLRDGLSIKAAHLYRVY